METIEIYKRGYDFYYPGSNYVVVPYLALKNQIIGFIKANFGEDAFKRYRFVVVRRKRN